MNCLIQKSIQEKYLCFPKAMENQGVFEKLGFSFSDVGVWRFYKVKFPKGWGIRVENDSICHIVDNHGRVRGYVSCDKELYARAELFSRFYLQENYESECKNLIIKDRLHPEFSYQICMCMMHEPDFSGSCIKYASKEMNKYYPGWNSKVDWDTPIDWDNPQY